jgi:beta-fructofuranosidase
MKRTRLDLQISLAALVIANAALPALAAEDAFKSIFDGQSLAGWKAADMSYWSVEDGAITARITPEHPLKNNLYLIWQGGDLADFELKLKHRVLGSKGINCGFQFRSKELPNHDVAGYQVDNNLDTEWLVRLYDEHGRETLAWRGQRTVFDENGRATHTDLPQAKGPPWFRLEDWHEYHLICDGTRLTLRVDGRLAAEVVDNDPNQHDLAGILGLQLHTGPPTTAQFKDIQLRVLKPVPVAQTSPAPPPLRDKTLVVWAAPANLGQKGGSALSIDDLQSHFDGIVLGELATKRWMPGSDGFNRTLRQQNTWPEETADPRTFVQVAITYQERRVTVYRNGQPYAQYTMANAPREFGPQSVVVLGMRHLDQGDDAHFAGAIDDARIYDRALSAEQIAALKPNLGSDPAPWAWWTFDDKAARDRTGRFTAVKLAGGAKVENGKLVLDGKAASLFAAPTAEDLAEVAQAAEQFVSASDSQAARRLRDQLLMDPYRALYHFVIPEGQAMPFDPNGAIFWKGRYHLFYIFQDERGHNWGHVSSTDLFHWRHHPTGLVSGMFSGNCFVNKEGRPTMCYHQVGQGNAMAVALDDELNEWKKLDSNPITPKTKPGDPHHDQYRSWDPYGWLEDGTYYAIFGGERPAIAKAPSLAGEWKYVGDLMANAVPGVAINEDVSCADFFRLGDRRMLLCISHRLGCRYYLGDWKNEQFHPTFHEKMSWVDNSFFAPESLLDDKGRRIMWAWIFDGPGFKKRSNFGWSGTMSLPRVLSLGPEGLLRMDPPEEIERLRYNAKKQSNLAVTADADKRLEGISGQCLELDLAIAAPEAKQFGLKVCCSPGGEEQTLVYYDAAEKKLKVDTTRSSLRAGPKSVEAGPFELKPDEPLQLRVFVDKSVVEVFANGRQAVMRRVYPSRRDSVGVALFSKGGPARVTGLEAWDMMPSNPL